MRRISDTELVRNYCEKHKGDIFDINYASERIFPDIPHVNLRKIVSRLIDAGLLRTLSKGVYAIGESHLNDEERVLNHYTKADSGYTIGMPVGDYLLYTKGYSDAEPVKKEIKSNATKGNKNIGNVSVIESKECFDPIGGGYRLTLAMELIAAGLPTNMEKAIEYTNEIKELLKKEYTDQNFRAFITDIYPANVYYQLELYLDSMQTSHRVREIYEVQVRIHSQKR